MLLVKATRLLLYGLLGSALFVLSLTHVTAEGNGISSPTNGERVFGTIAIRGIADTPNFLAWQLDVLLNGDEQAVASITRSKKQISKEDLLARLDTTTLPDGPHQLRLRVINIDGQYDEFFVSIIVNNADVTPTTEANSSVPRPTRVVRPTPTTLNQITAPSDGATVQGTILITGFADSPDFLSWKLDLLFDRKQDKSVTIAAERTRSPTGDFSTQLDTTQLPDGTHLLRLRVSKQDDTFTESTSSLTIANPKPNVVSQPTVCSTNILEDPPPLFSVFVIDWVRQLTDNLKSYCGA